MPNAMNFTMDNYQKHKPFSSFLSGIAGETGIPLWSYYVNRGQLIAGFGVRDKNGAIMEFFPANNAYHYVSRIGFRTFVKIQGVVHEFFREQNPGQKLSVRPDSVSIEETSPALSLRIKVTYFTLPQENLAALVRKVEIESLDPAPREIEVIDGLAQILPSGIDYGGYKAVSNLLQSWMQSYHEDHFVFYKLRASTSDSSEVAEISDGNFFLTSGPVPPLYISDYKLVFEEDTSLETPYGFQNRSLSELGILPQVHVNQVPCAMIGLNLSGRSKTTFFSLFGYGADKNLIHDFALRIYSRMMAEKEAENRKIHEELMSPVETETAFPMLDAYFKQCYLDNLLRGGKPIIFDTLDGTIGYHLYSRKHGDLERDYNFFVLEPAFYSQGNGSFRDVLQNRRNDVFFQPRLGDFNVLQFSSLLQADGYNPLDIEGIRFSFAGNPSSHPSVLKDLLRQPFTPGQAATILKKNRLEIPETLRLILSECHVEIRSVYGEGYWEDHFTYLLDLIDSYLAVFPDRKTELMFEKFLPYFVSPVQVRPRSEKTVIRKDGQVRQYGALKHLDKPKSGWLENREGRIKANLFGKLFTLVLNKFGHLDPDGIGLAYEAERPGWNDAMNGLPGLFGSGVSEAIELKKLVGFLIGCARESPDRPVVFLESTRRFAEALQAIPISSDPFVDWDARMTELERYRADLEEEPKITTVLARDWIPLLERIGSILDSGMEKALKLGPVMPTYLIFEAIAHDPILDSSGKPVIGGYGLPLTRVTRFGMKPLPVFLEAPARYLQAGRPTEEARELASAVKNTELYDPRFHFYQTSVSLERFGNEIGRIRAFTPGWLERESNFLHMTYKYLLGLLRSGMLPEFYEEMKTNFTCFMDPEVYGRSPLENSSFLATSANPDPKKRGQGFVSRLSGSTAEVLSMWRFLFFGEHPFRMGETGLVFELAPSLSASLFKNGVVKARLFDRTTVEYHLEPGKNTFDPGVQIHRMTLQTEDGDVEVSGSVITGSSAKDIRAGKVLTIKVYFRTFHKEEKQ